MSDATRFSVRAVTFDDGTASVIHSSDVDGEYVLHADYARLKAEVERLTAFTTRTIIPNEELQKQVERLTKAGDAVIHEWSSGEESDIDNFTKALWLWSVAKSDALPSNSNPDVTAR